jgi:Tfp pilus assembly protein PilF
MREAMTVLAISAMCLFSGSAHSQETTLAGPQSAEQPQAQPAVQPQAQPAEQPQAQTADQPQAQPAGVKDSVAPQDQPAASPKIQSQLERGTRLRAANRNTEALAVFNAVLAADPQNHAALVELGYLHADLKHYASAAKFLGAASEQDPANMRLHMDLGYALESAKQLDAAGAQFGVVAKEPGEFQDQAQKALQGIKDATDGAASTADAQQQRILQDGYDALERGDKVAARRKFEAAVKADPKSAAAQKQLGFINLDDGKNEAAARNFAAALAAAPSDYFIALQLGYTYQSLDKKDEARDAFKAAAASSDPKIHDPAVAQMNSSQDESASASPEPSR